MQYCFTLTVNCLAFCYVHRGILAFSLHFGHAVFRGSSVKSVGVLPFLTYSVESQNSSGRMHLRVADCSGPAEFCFRLMCFSVFVLLRSRFCDYTAWRVHHECVSPVPTVVENDTLAVLVPSAAGYRSLL